MVPTEIKFGSRPFKDILNRNIYKRLGDVASMKLVKDFTITDKEIYLDDASPNKCLIKLVESPLCLLMEKE